MTDEKNALNLGDFDFGFSLVDADELDEVVEIRKEYGAAEEEIEDLRKQIEGWQTQSVQWQQKAQTIYKAIQPLLNNLSVDPDKEYIFWPGEERVEKINMFKLRLMQILED
jgi:hypothetical protein